MGLDMFLNGKRFLWAHKNENKKFDVDGLVPDFMELNGLRTEVKYWRKSNAIHGWFVEHVQHGEDDCDEYEVSIKKLKELRDRCAKVLELGQDGIDLLPPTHGFFFGSDQADEWYFQDLKETVERLDQVLAMPDVEHWEFTYQSSW